MEIDDEVGRAAADRLRSQLGVDVDQILPGSSIEFYLNGVSQGVAFTDIIEGRVAQQYSTQSMTCWLVGR